MILLTPPPTESSCFFVIASFGSVPSATFVSFFIYHLIIPIFCGIKTNSGCSLNSFQKRLINGLSVEYSHLSISYVLPKKFLLNVFVGLSTSKNDFPCLPQALLISYFFLLRMGIHTHSNENNSVLRLLVFYKSFDGDRLPNNFYVDLQ